LLKEVIIQFFYDIKEPTSAVEYKTHFLKEVRVRIYFIKTVFYQKLKEKMELDKEKKSDGMKCNKLQK